MDYGEKTSVQLYFGDGILCHLISERERATVREKGREKEKNERLRERERKSGTLQIKIFFYRKQCRGLNRVPGLRRSYLGAGIYEQLLDHGDQHGVEEGGRNSSRKHTTFYSLTYILYQ